MSPTVSESVLVIDRIDGSIIFSINARFGLRPMLAPVELP